MKRSLQSPLALAILLTAIAGPAFAGNYAEGDLRPGSLTASTSRAAVQANTIFWMRSGLAAAQLGEAGADLSRPVHQRTAAEHATRRASPEFAELTQDIARKGMTVTTGAVR